MKFSNSPLAYAAKKYNLTAAQLRKISKHYHEIMKMSSDTIPKKTVKQDPRNIFKTHSVRKYYYDLDEFLKSE